MLSEIVGKTHVVSFKPALQTTSLPIVSFKQGDVELNFMLDTGANCSLIDSNILNEIAYTVNKEDNVSFSGCTGEEIQAYSADVEFEFDGKKFKDTFTVTDLTPAFSMHQENGININGVLGNIFMQKYHIVLDFKDNLVYIK